MLWALVLRLGWAFWHSDLTFAYVAAHSRRGASWPYRLAGVWGGMEGSLLLFAAIVASAAAATCRQPVRLWRWVAPSLSALVGAISLGMAGPFERLDVPAVEGFGLTPILEHPAMLIHPPLLYCGLAATLPAYLGVPRARTWLLSSMALLTAAMTLGGLWSYVEQGWGGYWAWDPVENASLATWLATLVALHAGGGAGRRDVALQRLAFVVALAGAGVARSGVTSSVHSFAEAGRIGAALAVVALVAAVIAAIDLRRRPRAQRLDAWRLTPTALFGAALAIVVTLTLTPLLGASGRAGARVEGRYFARALAPFALVAIVALAVAATRARRRIPRPAWVAHVGMVIVLTGIAGSTFERSERVALPAGATVEAIGITITNAGVTVGDGPHPGTSSVTAELELDGVRRRPALVSYPERGGVLAETAMVSRPWRDIQVVLLSAGDDGSALVEVRTKPFVQLIWVGAVLVMAGAALSARRRRGAPPRVPPQQADQAGQPVRCEPASG